MECLASVTVAEAAGRFIAGLERHGSIVRPFYYSEGIYIVAEPAVIPSRPCLGKGESLPMGDKGVACKRVCYFVRIVA